MFGFFYFCQMEQENKYEIISEGKRAWYEIALASVFFSVLVYLIVMTFYQAYVNPDYALFLGNFCNTLSASGFLIVMGIKFSSVKDIFIDTDTNELVSRYRIGLFSYKVSSKIKEFEYVSVFKDADEYYRTLLWYTGNKHYKMYFFEEEKPAFDFALMVSNKLNIDLLDATEKGNSIWVDKTKL
jgi:hypothetical protein